MDKNLAQCPCNTCGIVTEHDQHLIHELPETSSEGEELVRFISVVSCNGCKTTAIREDLTGPALGEDQIFYKPPRLWSPRPNWIDDLESTDANLYGILEEVYSATNEHQFRIFSMGVRAALDHTMTHIIGDIGGFEQKLDVMVAQDHISKKQKDMIETVIDAGSAAAHRGYRPPVDLLSQMLTVTEMIIRSHYITGPMLKTLKVKIPPRPPRKKTTP